jgi:multiple sugar transport system ATP-binding protein
MCVELRALHDRIQATTVYVTHDQVEAMAMADRIAVMNHGVVDQIAGPQQIYDVRVQCTSRGSSAARR